MLGLSVTCFRLRLKAFSDLSSTVLGKYSSWINCFEYYAEEFLAEIGPIYEKYVVSLYLEIYTNGLYSDATKAAAAIRLQKIPRV